MKTFAFQNKKQKDYFEGWYIRLNDENKHVHLALIFAITRDQNDPHAFIQYYNGTDHLAHYYRFDVDDFSFDIDTNTVHIGQNLLSPSGISVHTEDIALDADITISHPLKTYQHTTSAMGYLSKAPLECFQEVLDMEGQTTFTYNGLSYQGKSYIEKTYGTNFPKQWVWLQSNHSQYGSSISFSVGKVPVLFFYVKGFFLIYKYNGREKRFGSFNFSRIKVQSTKTDVSITIKKGCYKVLITAKTNQPVTLVGPRKKGIMDLTVFESIHATAKMEVYKCNKLEFEDYYTNVGLEIMY